MVGPASKGIAQLAAQGKRFDLAFLDADKTGYLSYYNQVLFTRCQIHLRSQKDSRRGVHGWLGCMQALARLQMDLGSAASLVDALQHRLCLPFVGSQSVSDPDCPLLFRAADGPEPHRAWRSHHCGQHTHEGTDHLCFNLEYPSP